MLRSYSGSEMSVRWGAQAMNAKRRGFALLLLLFFALQATALAGQAPGVMRLSGAEMALGIGETGVLYASILPSSAPQRVYYRSERPEIAAVAPDGTVLHEAGAGPETFTVDIEPEVVARVRGRLPVLANSRYESRLRPTDRP